MEIDRIPANVLQPQHHNHQLQQSMIADILNVDDHTNTMSFLSSSVPSESTTATSNTTATTYSQQRNPFQRVSSAPSSPTHRSRSQSLSTTAGGEDSSLKHLLTNLINGETSYLDQTEDVKLVRRWVKLDGHIYLANFLLILISDGLCAVVVCKDDPDKVIAQGEGLRCCTDSLCIYSTQIPIRKCHRQTQSLLGNLHHCK